MALYRKSLTVRQQMGHKGETRCSSCNTTLADMKQTKNLLPFVLTIVALVGSTVHTWIYKQLQQRAHYSSEIINDVPTSLSRKGRYAYAFVVAGCTPTSCLGYILNALVTASVLHMGNSDSHIIFQVQVMREASNQTTVVRKNTPRLHPLYESWLKKAEIRLDYIPASNTHNFGVATLHKFRVWNWWKDYDRILFLDADILLMCPMDYMFQKSYDGWLQPNVAIAGAVAPATASIFLATPQVGVFAHIVNLVQQQRLKNLTKFDPVKGWGHTIHPDDPWESWGKRKRGTQWDFYAANSDQGLLYHWMKYEHGNYTHIHADRVETWGTVDGEHASVDEKVFPGANGRFVKRLAVHNITDLRGCGDPMRHSRGGRTAYAPWLDHFHFAGKKKPWNQVIRSVDIPIGFDDWNEVVSVKNKLWSRTIWLFHLGRANETFKLGLPSKIEANKGNPLGYKATASDLFLSDIELPV